MWPGIAKAACCVAGVIALASASLYGLWTMCVWRGKVLVIRSDHLLHFRIVCLIPFLVIIPTLLGYHSRSPLAWTAVVLFAWHFFGLGQHVLSALYIGCYNIRKANTVLAVRRALVLADIEFCEDESQFRDKDDSPLAEVEFEAERPEGKVHVLSGATLRLYHLLAASCVQSDPTPGASGMGFALCFGEMLCVGVAAMWLTLFGIA